MKCWLFLLLLLTNMGYSQNLDKPEFNPVPDRTPAYPLKDKSLFFTEDRVQIARNKVANNQNAKEVENQLLATAEQWLSWDDEDLLNLIADASVPRSFDLNSMGCPVHGDTIFKIGGAYPWIIDPLQPFKVKCPAGDEVYPSNDYQEYYNSNFTQKIKEAGNYVDDGWGWTSPENKKYWFVAYANHWLLMKFIQPAIRDLGRAYVLTNKEEYAHKALVLLFRLAEVYPSMKYENQSRYGQMQQKEGRRYQGKVLNKIWEAFFIKDVAESYDAVWGHIQKDEKLQDLLAKDAYKIQAFIEANLLEEAVEAYDERDIQGNFGMHQIALLYVMMARQNLDNEELVHKILNNKSKEYLHTGIDYALYNFVFRDGTPMESPGYNMLWIRTLTNIADRLQPFNINLFDEPRLKSVLESPIEMSVWDKYSIDVGDSGNTLGGIIGKEKNIYEIAYMNYGDSTFLQWLNYGARDNVKKAENYNFESLFRPDFEVAEKAYQFQNSKLFAGYGMGLLHDNLNNSAIALTYGYHGSHYHWDFLNIELFAHGQKLLPDFGYPDAMNAYVPSVYTWSKNTVAHNTVVVDQKKQPQNLPGVLHDYSIGHQVKMIDASSPTYNQTSLYRRQLIMVDSDPNAYTVDFFRVRGGKQHDYMLHSGPGQIEQDPSEWSEPMAGTFAGPDVELNEIYDDEKLGAENYNGGYTGYKGSGYQHLFNVQKREKGKGIVDFIHLNDDESKLKVRMLTTDDQELFMADVYNLPRAKTHIVKQLVCQSKSKSDDLESTFISVLEPYKNDGFISDAFRLPISGSNSAAAVEVQRKSQKDIIISDIQIIKKKIDQYNLETDATTAVITLNEKSQLQSAFFSNGNYLKYKGKKLKAQKTTGEIVGIDYKNRKISIILENGLNSRKMKNLNSEVVFIHSESRETVHPIKNIEWKGKEMTITSKDDILIGKLNVDRTNDSPQFFKSNHVMFFDKLYLGAYMLNKDFKEIGQINSIRRSTIKLNSDPKINIFKNSNTEDVWIGNLGVGDKIELQTKLEWEK